MIIVANMTSRKRCVALTLASMIAAIPQATAEPLDRQAATSAKDLELMSLSLREVVSFNVGFQGQTQAAGTPNELGVGAFMPLVIGGNSVLFLDALANVNLADINNSSSIVNTEVAGTTISGSTRLGYRWLNANRSWLYGVHVGYDSRPVATGKTDTGVLVTNSQTVFFQQVAAGLEMVNNRWGLNVYGLIPTGTTEAPVNSNFAAGSLDTYGLDLGFNITPAMRTSLGYYYQSGDADEADGSGVRGRVSYALSDGLTVGANLSYDQAFSTRFSADIRYRFGSRERTDTAANRTAENYAVIRALTQAPAERDVRVHDLLLDGVRDIALRLFGVKTTVEPQPSRLGKAAPAGYQPRIKCPPLRLNFGGRRNGLC